jgi:hypothetical protein
MDFILNVVRALSMAQELPFFAALPVYILAYGIGLAGIGFGLRQVVSAITQIIGWFKK